MTVRGSLRTPRAAGIAGVLFALLLTAALVLVRLAAPADPADVGAWLADPGRRHLVILALHIVPFAGIAFLWFIGVVRDRIGQREDKFFATVFLGSGLLFVAMLFVATGVATAVLADAAARPGGATDSWVLGQYIATVIMHTYAMRMAAVFMILTATIGLRTGSIPRSLGFSGYAIAVILLLGIDLTLWVEVLFPLWILILSVYILVEGKGTAPTAPGGRRDEGIHDPVKQTTLTTLALASLLILTLAVAADEATANDALAALARQEQNPLARLIRLQLEDNAQFGFGPDNEVLNFLRIQPVIPFNLSEDWSLITRPVIPIVHQPWPESADGLSDIGLQLLLSPEKSGKFIWGAGPSFVFPTATGEIKFIGTEKWSAGPAVVGVYTSGPWVVGAVVNQLWSFAGDDSRPDVNAMTLRPIINYNLPNGWYLTSSPTIAANWEADRNNRWLVPLGGGVAKLFPIGSRWMSISLEGYYHVESPEIGPDWQLRLQLTVLFPK